jgi:HK97 family phage prohead protease
VIAHRSAPVTKRSGDGRTVDVRAVAYSVLDRHGTVFAPGFGAEHLKTWAPTVLWAHEMADPVGVTTSHSVRSDGAYLTLRLSDPEAVPRARQAVTQLGDGTIRAVSIGFQTTKRRDPTAEERKRWPGVREILLDGDILEVSLVAAGSVPGADVLAVREGLPQRLGAAGHLDARTAALYAEADEALDRLAQRGLLPTLPAPSQRSWDRQAIEDLLDRMDRR